uniref:Uncharacterized protein n=1 Tax=Pristionchus pacificus TaxID=54126 RepID=A0A2A6BYR7_PRIPA|eukprot:PDM71065.1 hypothetical protein PRIPAC_44461 [Pristionchus pacificus]
MLEMFNRAQPSTLSSGSVPTFKERRPFPFLAGSGAGGTESSLSIFTARRTAPRTGRLAMGSSSSISSSSSSQMSVKTWKDDVLCWREEGLSYEEIRKKCLSYGIKTTKSRIGRIITKRYGNKKIYASSSISRDNFLPIKEFVKEAYLANAQRKATEIVDDIADKFDEKITVAVLRRIRISIGLEKANRRYGHSVRMANRQPRYTFCRLHLDLGTMFLTHCFTDESMVQSCVTGRFVYILKGDNSRRVQPRHKHPASLMIWGGISWEGATPLAIIRRGINEWWNTKLTKDHCRRLILRMQKQMEKVVQNARKNDVAEIRRQQPNKV